MPNWTGVNRSKKNWKRFRAVSYQLSAFSFTLVVRRCALMADHFAAVSFPAFSLQLHTRCPLLIADG
jgi:hypothetical protein